MGVDSTQALLVAVGCMDELGLPRTNVLAYTMPGFATSARTLRNAHQLMEALGVTGEEIDIKPAATQMLHDLRHRAATGAADYDVTYENVQAGARTSLLFRLANLHGGAGARHRRPVRARARAGAPTASATRCRTTRSTRRCPRR